MSQVTARLSDELVEALDAADRDFKRSRAEVIRQAVERDIEDFDMSLHHDLGHGGAHDGVGRLVDQGGEAAPDDLERGRN